MMRNSSYLLLGPNVKTKDITKKENSKPISLMNIEKILNPPAYKRNYKP